MKQKRSRAFISYAHEPPGNKSRVGDLAEQLFEDGIDCTIDQDVRGSPPESWPTWAENQLREADFVLLVCDEVYLRNFDQAGRLPKAGGVMWEAHFVRQLLYETGGRNTKFIPIFFGDIRREHIPLVIRGHTTYSLPAQYGLLLDALGGTPRRRAPPAEGWLPSPRQIGLETLVTETAARLLVDGPLATSERVGAPPVQPGLAPVPCTINGVTYENAFEELWRRLHDHLRKRAELRRQAREVARTEAVERTVQFFTAQPGLPDGNGVSRQLQQEYDKVLRKQLLVHEPAPLKLLISADTGAGKTTLAENLHRALGATFLDLRNYSQSRSLEAMLARADVYGHPRSGNRFLSEEPHIAILDALDKMLPGATYEDTTRLWRELDSSTGSYHIVLTTVRTQFFRTLLDEVVVGTTRVKLLPLQLEAAFGVASASGTSVIAAAKRSRRLAELLRRPLLLQLLLGMSLQPEELSRLEDEEQLFARLIDLWMERDTRDSIITAYDRLKCMQALALRALSTGGGALRYADIDVFAKRLLTPSDAARLERLNSDLRVCGFLRRRDPDLFEFQHASFYEYCIARTVFEDLARDDLVALDSQPFTDAILDFIVRRATRQKREGQVLAHIQRAWNSPALGVTAQGNLLKLHARLGGQTRALSFHGRTFENLTLEGLELSGMTLESVTFRRCDFAGARLRDIQGRNWLLEDCRLEAGTFQDVELTRSDVRGGSCLVDSGDCLDLKYCALENVRLQTRDTGLLLLTGGKLASCRLETQNARAAGGARIKMAVINRLSVGQSLRAAWIHDCTVDELSLLFLNSLPEGERPLLQEELAKAASLWDKDALRVKAIQSPYARTEPPPPAGAQDPFQQLSAKTRKKARQNQETMKALTERAKGSTAKPGGTPTPTGRRGKKTRKK